MDCPACRAPNPDDAAACSLCHAFLKAKPAKDQWAPPKRLVVPHAETHIGGWVFSGPLVADAEALYFFFGSAQLEIDPRKRLGAMLIGQFGGILGGVVMDRAVEAAHQGEARPAVLRYGYREEIELVYTHALTAAPRIAECREYFRVDFDAVKAFSIPEADTLIVRTADYELEVHGDLKDEVGARLTLWGYPRHELPARRRGWKVKALGLLLFAAGALALVGDAVELQKLAWWVGQLRWLQGLFDRSSSAFPYFVGALCLPVIIWLGWLCIKAGYRSID